MTVYKEIPKFNFKNVVYKNDMDPETGEITPIPASQERYLFYRINKRQDLAGIVIPLYEEYVDPETGETKTRPVLQEKIIQGTEDDQIVTPDLEDGYLGLSRVVVKGIDKLDEYTVKPEQNPQTITVNKYLGDIKVSGVDADIDNDIKTSNIRHGVTILGVTGEYSGDQPIAPVVSDEVLILYDAAEMDEDNPGTVVINQ